MILTSREHARRVLAARPGVRVSSYQPKDQAMPNDRIVTTTETANRAAVAIDLADAVEHLPHGRDADTVAAMPERGWRMLADLAGCDADYIPSAETRATVVAILRRRAAAEAADPFRSFPS